MEAKLISKSDAKLISEFYRENLEHLSRWEPLRESSYHSEASWQERLPERIKEQDEGKSAYFILYDAKSRKILATCSLTNIARGAFQACNMGYSVAELYQGKGLMVELCNYAISYAFDELHLNRIMANYMPSNNRSEALLTRLGFVKEGVAEKYLKINGQWEDHVLTSLLNPYRINKPEPKTLG